MNPIKEGDDLDTASEPIIIAETDKDFPIFSAKEAAEELEKSKHPLFCLKMKKTRRKYIISA